MPVKAHNNDILRNIRQTHTHIWCQEHFQSMAAAGQVRWWRRPRFLLTAAAEEVRRRRRLILLMAAAEEVRRRRRLILLMAAAGQFSPQRRLRFLSTAAAEEVRRRRRLILLMAAAGQFSRPQRRLRILVAAEVFKTSSLHCSLPKKHVFTVWVFEHTLKYFNTSLHVLSDWPQAIRLTNHGRLLSQALRLDCHCTAGYYYPITILAFYPITMQGFVQSHYFTHRVSLLYDK